MRFVTFSECFSFFFFLFCTRARVFTHYMRESKDQWTCNANLACDTTQRKKTQPDKLDIKKKKQICIRITNASKKKKTRANEIYCYGCEFICKSFYLNCWFCKVASGWCIILPNVKYSSRRASPFDHWFFFFLLLHSPINLILIQIRFSCFCDINDVNAKRKRIFVRWLQTFK